MTIAQGSLGVERVGTPAYAWGPEFQTPDLCRGEVRAQEGREKGEDMGA